MVVAYVAAHTNQVRMRAMNKTAMGLGLPTWSVGGGSSVSYEQVLQYGYFLRPFD